MEGVGGQNKGVPACRPGTNSKRAVRAEPGLVLKSTSRDQGIRHMRYLIGTSYFFYKRNSNERRRKGHCKLALRATIYFFAGEDCRHHR